MTINKLLAVTQCLFEGGELLLNRKKFRVEKGLLHQQKIVLDGAGNPTERWVPVDPNDDANEFISAVEMESLSSVVMQVASNRKLIAECPDPHFNPADRVGLVEAIV